MKKFALILALAAAPVLAQDVRGPLVPTCGPSTQAGEICRWPSASIAFDVPAQGGPTSPTTVIPGLRATILWDETAVAPGALLGLLNVSLQLQYRFCPSETIQGYAGQHFGFQFCPQKE